MQIKQAAERLGISQRMLRHYETQGLLGTTRSENGYRHYSEADLNRAARIRQLVALGFSTREVKAMADCLSDEGARPCEAGLALLARKLQQIERQGEDLSRKRAAILTSMMQFRASLAGQTGKDEIHHEDGSLEEHLDFEMTHAHERSTG